MSDTPVLDPRSKADILAEVRAHARSYTPEWNCDGSPEDPGSALAELFADMFYQTVDRMNSVMGKLHTEFLRLTGFEMPDPVPASGILQFTAHETVEEPVPVPAGTQVFAERGDDDILYETERAIEATAAHLTGAFYTDSRRDLIERLDFSRPQTFFAPAGGENLQRHLFTVSQNDVLALRGPCRVEIELRQQSDLLAQQTAKRLAEEGRWSFRGSAGKIPFSGAAAEGNRVVLHHDGAEEIAPDDGGNFSIACTGFFGSGSILLEGVRVRSSPLGALPIDAAACGDVPLDLENGDYCLGRRPAPYSICYFRSDCVFRKRGAQVNLHLNIGAAVTNYVDPAPQYSFTQRIIDKRDAVAVVPDDVYVDQVTWEYFNGFGWCRLQVTGSKNPFSARQEGSLETVFTVPEDMEIAEVNAESGYYIRARVIHVENEYSTRPRWIVPFLHGASCVWSYPEPRPIDACTAENNGSRTEMTELADVEVLHFPAYSAMEEQPPAVCFCFDASPDAMPLSVLFELAGSAQMDDKLRCEAWTGSRFESVRSIDLTRNFHHSGMMLLYLPRKLPESELFGVRGCWLRLSRSSYLENSCGYPRVRRICLNTVSAIQREHGADAWFSAESYEAGKQLELQQLPVLDAEVWVDEIGALAVADAEELEKTLPGRVHAEREDAVMLHCWVRWERTEALELAAPDERCYHLDPYLGLITFGDGQHGKVPPAGRSNIRVRYGYGGGSRGNCPAGRVNDLIGTLPRISQVTNLTAMSGGTDRFSPEKADAVGGSFLRTRGCAAGVQDYEEIILREYPQARHVKCFSGRDETGRSAAGHVTVVVEGCDLDDRRVTDELCQRIYEGLCEKCDCVLTAEHRLHVIGSTVVTINSDLTVELENPDQGALTQQNIAAALEELINRRWRQREIGSQLRLDEVWQKVRGIPNVRLIKSIRLEGSYDDGGEQRLVALEQDDLLPYATAKSGKHHILIE